MDSFSRRVRRNSLFQTDFWEEEYFDSIGDAWYILAFEKRRNSCVFFRLRQPLFLKMIDSRRISIGRYLPFETHIHRVDARTKIVCAVGLVAALFTSPAWQSWAVALLGLAIVSRASGIPAIYLLGNVRSLLPILVMTLVLNGFLTPGHPVWAGQALTYEGLTRGGTLCLRLVVIVTVTSLLSLTTSPIQLADAIQSLLGPLAGLRLPVHELALTTTIALRLIPLLADEASRIRTAQLSRGATSRGSLARRMRDLGAILIPLFTAAFMRRVASHNASSCVCVSQSTINS